MSGGNGPLLGAEQIRSLLVELGARLAAKGVEAQIFLVEGAAMALAFNRRRLTRDLDAVFEPKAVIYEEAAQMAHRNGLPPDWLNDAVKGLAPDRSPLEEGTTFSAPGVRVGVASAEYLFAMKAQAARQDADSDDLRFLATELRLKSTRDALDLVERYYGKNRLGAKTQFLIEDIMGHLAAERAAGRGDA